MSDLVARAGGDVDSTDSALTAGEYNSWLETTSLRDIAVVAQSSERTASGDSEITRFELEAGYQVVDDGLQYRFTATATILAEGDIEVGVARAAVVAVIDSPTKPSAEAIEYFGSTSVPMMVHPYVREALSTAAARVGFHGITLPRITHQPIKMSVS